MPRPKQGHDRGHPSLRGARRLEGSNVDLDVVGFSIEVGRCQIIMHAIHCQLAVHLTDEASSAGYY